MIATFFILIVFVLILFAIMSNNVEQKPQLEAKPGLREDAFYDYVDKYAAKIAPSCLVNDLRVYAKKVVEKMLSISKEYKKEGYDFKLADEMELIECSLELCLKKYL